jgi:hypothetical protein
MDTKVPTEVVSKLIGIVADSKDDDEVSFISLDISYEDAHLQVKRRDGTSETHSFSDEEAMDGALRALFS